jgi:cytochrome P450
MTGFALQTLVGSIFGVESGREAGILEDGVVARRDSMTRGLASLTPLPAFLPIAVRRRRRRAIKRLDETIERLIRARREQAAPGDDLLSMVMGAHDGGLPASDPRQARDQALTLALAAYENIARALTWTFLALARHPDVEAKVRVEVEQVLGDRSPDAVDAASLRYTEMTVAESMRLWPPTPLVSRIARQDDVLPTGTRIRAGSKVLLSSYVVQRDLAYYPDPERFLPERFSEEARRERPRYAYFPFGGGPRICIGQPLAMLACTLALARVTQRARLELVDEPADYICGCLPSGFGPRVRLRSLA